MVVVVMLGELYLALPKTRHVPVKYMSTVFPTRLYTPELAAAVLGYVLYNTSVILKGINTHNKND